MQAGAELDWDAAFSGAPVEPRRRTNRPPAVICVGCLKRFYRHLKRGETKYLCDDCRAADAPEEVKRELPVPYNEFPPGY